MKFRYESNRYTLNDYLLHAGDPVTVVAVNGTKTNTSIEFDRDRNVWYLIGYEEQSLDELSVE